MKILSLIAAALVASTGIAAAAPASAQERVIVRERTVVPVRRAETRVVVRERTRVRRGYGYGNRYAYGRNRYANRRVCTVRFRRGERIRTCRIRRY